MGQGGGTPYSIDFPAPAWSEDVEALNRRSSRRQAERARRQIEAGQVRLRWSRCDAEGGDGTSLALCWKLYVPLDAIGASAAPWGFVFGLVGSETGAVLRFLAFGERHPVNPATRSVYERAHKRLHGRYP